MGDGGQSNHRLHQWVEADTAVRACGEQARVHRLVPPECVEAEHKCGLAQGVAIAAATTGGGEKERGAGRRGQLLDPGAEGAAQARPDGDPNFAVSVTDPMTDPMTDPLAARCP
ncbi:hypothetical protein [Streptomyces deccanensis]|uniref:hypothetical protein n=1 Tax=Streptomyces deccanensis TaxID=424188 RepID=UPI001EFC2B6D|nr:hypothetical protein [Streptomyces deccanensis]ULR48429.1 hypothetical protein L3078_03540 [Streptomyces deccanensis]